MTEMTRPLLSDDERDPPGREDLPLRRQQLIRHIKFQLFGDREDREIVVGGGYMPLPFPKGGRILEVFVDAPLPQTRGDRNASGFKVGSQVYFALNDEAVMISMLLQFGFTPRGLRRCLGGGEKGLHADAPGRPTSHIGAIVDALIAMQDELDETYGPKAIAVAD